MHSAKQKVADAAAVAQEHAEILKAKAEEKTEVAVARTEVEKEIAHERRKAKEAEAKMKMHEAKAQHLEEKLYGKHHGLCGHHQHGHQGHHEPVGAAIPPTGAVAPTYPLGGHPPGWTDRK
ncbi:hypothetical protein Pfo_010584 [Paulownia fortunei]|nr:hypothetical protein Pfo_010584 [Paulownia fortunei]